mgnify:CR=1 FL=1
MDEQLQQAGLDLGQGAEVERLKEENAQLRDQLLRAVAETENEIEEKQNGQCSRTETCESQIEVVPTILE